MRAAIIDTEAALHDIAPAWQALWERSARNPFLSPAWLLPWWRAFGTGRPRIATLFYEGTLAGLLPLYRLDEGEERKLLPMGVGISDEFDALAPGPAEAAMLLKAALAHAATDGITSCTLAELPPGALLRAAAAPWQEQDLPPTPCPVLRRGDPIPPGQLRNLRQSRHRADRTGGWAVREGTADEAPALWARLMAMHETRWAARGEPGGVLADPAVRRFHAVAVPELAAAGLLRMQVLEIGGEIAALYHTLAAPGRLLFYLSGFDAAYALASPGTLLLGAIIERAAIDELHFLRGPEAYKYAWGALDRLNTSRLLRPS